MTMAESLGSHRLRNLVDPWSYYLWWRACPIEVVGWIEQLNFDHFQFTLQTPEPFIWDIEDIVEEEAWRKANR